MGRRERLSDFSFVIIGSWHFDRAFSDGWKQVDLGNRREFGALSKFKSQNKELFCGGKTLSFLKKIKKKTEETGKKGWEVGKKVGKKGVEVGKKAGKKGVELGKKGAKKTKEAVK